MQRLARREKREIGWWLMGIGLGLVLIGWGFEYKPEEVLSKSTVVIEEEVKKPRSVKPVGIKIPKVSVDLGVEEGGVVDNVWEISSKGVSHWDQSVSPGEKGNMVIYGHNHNHLFGPIRWLELGDEVEVVNEDGEVFSYKVVLTEVVTSEDVSKIQPTNEEILTMYTCDGVMDSKRYVVRAEPMI